MNNKSAAELNIETMLKTMQIKLERTYVSIKDAEALIEFGYKILNKCEELRKSRDNHAVKRKESELRIKELEKEIKDKLK